MVNRLAWWMPLAALALASCSSSTGASVKQALPTTTVTVEPSTTTLDPTTTTTVPPEPPPPPGLGPGDTGPAVQDLEQRLSALHYEVGDVDDSYDRETAHGVTAFQKVNDLERSGRATDDVVAAVAASTSPPPALVPGGGDNRVEIDLNRQVLFLYEADALYKVLPVSTGSNSRFCSQGWCRRAVTNEGAFRIYSQRQGWETSPLGRLYNSQYFDGGIAIHGSPSVPAEPASHGCVRIPMSSAEWFPDHVSVGTPVYVAGDAVPGPLPPPVPEAASPAPDAPPDAGTDAVTVPTLAPPVTFVPRTPTAVSPASP